MSNVIAPLIFIIDDDLSCLKVFKAYVKKMGYEPICFDRSESFVEAFKNFDLNQEHLILSDINMPGLDGFDLIKNVKEISENSLFIFLTGTNDIDVAVDAMRAGAYDFLRKPVFFDEFKVRLERALGYFQLCSRKRELESEFEGINDFFGVKGASDQMKEIFVLLRKVSKVDASVLITGESGTGKEKIAKAIHQAGPRKNEPFVAVNCSAIPENLIESELFGHEKGSFTGADSKKIGLFQEANGGTVFLDEIGDMPYSLQAKILRTLQEKEVRPVGSNKTFPIDVRVLAATHQDLQHSIAQKEFREDLFYRLSVFPIEIPPLRSRKEDILLLANFFLKKFSKIWDKPVLRLSKSAEKALLSHSWPGNIRELENSIERAMILCEGRELDHEHLSLSKNRAASLADWIDKLETFPTLKEFEVEFIKTVLKRTDGHKDQAARILGIGRKTLYRKEKELGDNLNL